MFKVNEPVASRRSLKTGRVIRIEDGLFECEMNDAYYIEGKQYDNCRYWFRAADLLRPYEVTDEMTPNDTWGGKPVFDRERTVRSR